MIPIALSWPDYSVAMILFAIVTWLGISSARHASEETFLVGGRNVPWWLLAPTIAAGVLGGGILLVFSEYAHKYGLSALAIILGIAIGTLLLIPVALRFKHLADAQSFYSFPDLFRHEWGRRVGNWALGVVLLWTLGFIMMQFVAAGMLLKVMTGMPYWQGIALVAAIVATYLIRGGFRSVMATDGVQYVALIVLLFVVLPASVRSINWQTSWELSLEMNPFDAFGFLLLGVLNMLVSADLWQRIYAARSLSDARKGIRVAALLILLGGCLFMLPALAARQVGVELPDDRLALVVSIAAHVPRLLLGLAMAAVLMAVMSTLDTMVFVLGLSVSHDVMVEFLRRSVRFRLHATRLAMALALIAGVACALPGPDLLDVGLAVSSFGLILTPAVLFRTKDRQLGPQAVLWSIYLGLTCALFLVVGEFVVGEILTARTAPVVLVPALLGVAIGGLIDKRHR